MFLLMASTVLVPIALVWIPLRCVKNAFWGWKVEEMPDLTGLQARCSEMDVETIFDTIYENYETEETDQIDEKNGHTETPPPEAIDDVPYSPVVVDAPGLDAPVEAPVEAPGLDAPGLDAPGLDAPGLEAPGLEAPGLEAPGLDAPGLDAPGLDAPGLDAPGLDAPGLDAPGLDIVRQHTDSQDILTDESGTRRPLDSSDKVYTNVEPFANNSTHEAIPKIQDDRTVTHDMVRQGMITDESTPRSPLDGVESIEPLANVSHEESVQSDQGQNDEIPQSFEDQRFEVASQRQGRVAKLRRTFETSYNKLLCDLHRKVE